MATGEVDEMSFGLLLIVVVDAVLFPFPLAELDLNQLLKCPLLELQEVLDFFLT